MATEHSTTEIFEMLLAQATCLWGEEDAERQRSGLQRTAEEIVIMNHYALLPDLEPRFF